MTSRPEFSIIVPFRSNEQLFRLCLHTLIRTTPSEAEKLIVASGPSADRVPSGPESAGVTVLRFEEILSYPAAINKGALIARGRTLLFCDADTFYTGSWFLPLTTFHRNTPDVGLASSCLLDPHTGRVIDFGVAFTTYNAPHPQRGALPDHPLVTRPRVVQGACSANMIISAQVFSDSGSFDSDLPVGYCDLDLCLRLISNGRSCWVVPGSSVFHLGNSARANVEAQKADTKALFAHKNKSRIRIDMHHFFEEAIAFFSKTHGLADEYVVIDLLSVIDRVWHHEIIKQHMRVAVIYDYSVTARDTPAISLVEHLGINVLESRSTLLYLVDSFLALRANHLWSQLRDRKDDLVIDRNANITLLSDLLDGRF